MTACKGMPTIDIDKLEESCKKRNSSGRRARRKYSILKRDDFRCTNCNSKTELTIAHIKPLNKSNGRNMSDFKLNECKVLCRRCHINEEHSTKEA